MDRLYIGKDSDGSVWMFNCRPSWDGEGWRTNCDDRLFLGENSPVDVENGELAVVADFQIEVEVQ